MNSYCKIIKFVAIYSFAIRINSIIIETTQASATRRDLVPVITATRETLS